MNSSIPQNLTQSAFDLDVSSDQTSPQKRCTLCHEIKPLTDFTKRKNRSDGRQSWCKLCSKEKRQQYVAGIKIEVDPNQTRQCSLCHETKPVTEFYASPDCLYGVKGQCKTCYTPRHNAHRKKPGYKPQNYPKYIRVYALRNSYGLTVAQYDEMLVNQNGVCALCGQPETAKGSGGTVRRLAVDHDHITGVVRGLLCGACNYLLGNAKDSPDLLRKAANYLERYK